MHSYCHLVFDLADCHQTPEIHRVWDHSDELCLYLMSCSRSHTHYQPFSFTWLHVWVSFINSHSLHHTCRLLLHLSLPPCCSSEVPALKLSSWRRHIFLMGIKAASGCSLYVRNQCIRLTKPRGLTLNLMWLIWRLDRRLVPERKPLCSGYVFVSLLFCIHFGSFGRTWDFWWG